MRFNTADFVKVVVVCQSELGIKNTPVMITLKETTCALNRVFLAGFIVFEVFPHPLTEDECRYVVIV